MSGREFVILVCVIVAAIAFNNIFVCRRQQDIEARAAVAEANANALSNRVNEASIAPVYLQIVGLTNGTVQPVTNISITWQSK